ncbi:TPA: RNA polymerase factor sigma-54 [Legionella pneumophila]|uniref:RNA polymerase factor sigma-54 n=1 Tax=Legionella pneumophila TaxID=446 RepID=UPI000786BEB9|nr:RNA polymerase factor sigma-54 [Legionella pneumophila]MDW8879587.1 RNA polymerase factor sigma-54 [Legionella pneumophila subsp. fraseri]MDW8962644.1 RNA polymerase factor sigma-54 [Legionella pneumophila subsp. fraseri]MDW9036639.1 RNA polymerase factor sigma-54 [Legionella pneumophila subsp. fraseri]MDW9039843.1 RNA polymerase factor sigma-54 [Legionella pneumophila subsp. fraseri]MDW9042833.1 RNA polymerase factor sigma-54 [Legionella pneumophila subsp. fraseri]
MKPTLQIGIGQHLTLTPQLQQAIRLLQLSTFDLQQEIQLVVESNPLLEATPVEEKEDLQINTNQNQDEYSDFQWSQLYNNLNKRSNFDDNDYNFDNLHCTTTNLQDHLNWQLDLTPMSDIDRVIATTIIDAINDDGFLTIPVAEIHASLNSEDFPLDIEEIEAVRHRLQLFDPVGCASVNLAETLVIQLEQLPLEPKLLATAKKIILEDIELLGQHNYRQLMKNHQISEKIIHEILQVIHKLNPKPGSLIHQENTEYVIPDLTVKKIDNQWKVFLNQDILPRLSINSQYAALIQRANNSLDNQFLKHNLQEARWFLKSIQSRQETLLKVATCIMEYQHGFLEFGEEAMKPLILNDVASALDMHESTVSRVTTQKFINTPRGVFELKYFFSSHVNTDSGGECSSTAIRAVIKKLISAENRKKPLSDSKIAQLIGEQGIKVARRTVAKYREAMGIPPSNERKVISS